jgi:hypothetical protein
MGRVLRLLVVALAGCARHAPARLVVSQPEVAMPFCTRTLGVAECFADPAVLPDRPVGLGDMPVRVHALPEPWWRVLE